MGGVVPFDDVVDSRGREYFLNFRLEEVKEYDLGAAGVAMTAPTVYDTDSVLHWKGKGHLFLPCLGQNQFWFSQYPVSFHGYKDPTQLLRVHEKFKGTEPCIECPPGYQPKISEAFSLEKKHIARP